MKIDLYHLYRHLDFTHLAFPIILNALRLWAAHTDWQFRVSVCKEQQVDLATDAEVVGFSVYTQTAPAVYRLSSQLRRRGKVVIFGGPHFRGPHTYAEAAPYCDVVVSSICKTQWLSLLTDIAREKIAPGRRRPLCVVDTNNEFRYPDEFYQAFANQKWYQIPSVPTSIGCPYDCDFCSPYLPGKYILRDVQTICNEIAHTRRKMIFICDASFALNRRFTLELMRALAPLKKQICVESTLARLNDKKILDALAEGGVKWIVTGIESLYLKMQKHGTAGVGKILRPVVDCAHDHGMVVQGNLICGLDSDGPESFDRTFEFIIHSNLDAAMLGILTPYPNTPLYRRLKRQDRILDHNWEHYDYRHVVYQPLRMSIDQLVEGYTQLYNEISKTRYILKEAFQAYRNSGVQIQASAVTAYNIYNKFVAKKEKKALRQNLKK